MPVFPLQRKMKLMAPFAPSEMPADTVSRTLAVEARHSTRLARRTVVTVLLLIAASLAWASATPIHRTVSAQGEISTTQERRQVSHLEGGIVQSVLVESGEHVEKGAPLVEFSDVKTQSLLDETAAQIEETETSLALFRAILADDDLFWGEGDQEPTAKSHYSAWIEQRLHMKAQLRTFEAERANLQAELPGLEDRSNTLQEEADIIDQQIAMDSQLAEGGLLPARRLRETRRDGLRIRRELDEIRGRTRRIKAETELLAARKDEVRAELRRDAARNIALLETQTAELEARQRRLSGQLERLVVIAPTDGVIHDISVAGAGDVVQPGGMVVELVPASAPSEARVEVPADRVGPIRVGSEAHVKVAAYDANRYGDLLATVTYISPSRFERNDGTRYFEIRLNLEPLNDADIELLNKLMQGMAVNVDLLGERHSMLHYILHPLRILTGQ